MRGGLPGPCVCACVCVSTPVLSHKPCPICKWLTRLSLLAARDFRLILTPNNGRFASSCLRFSHFQNTHTHIHSTRLLSSRLTLKTLLTFSGGGCPVASRSLWVCNPRHHRLFKACARELFFLSSPQKPCTHTHNVPLSVSPPQVEKNSSWHVKQAYERGSHDSDH